MSPRIPNREREHAVQLLDTLFAELLISMKDDFGVRRGSKPVTPAKQQWAEVLRVVAFAVVGDPDCPVFVAHRLTPALAQIHNRKPCVAEQAAATILNTMAIGSAMGERSHHTFRGCD